MLPKRILMHSLAYSIEGLMATMIAELFCVISLKASRMPNPVEWEEHSLSFLEGADCPVLGGGNLA